MNGDRIPIPLEVAQSFAASMAVDPAAWRNACALRTLAGLPPANLGNGLLSELLEANLERKAPPAERLRALDQAAELYDSWDQPEAYRLS